jgi:DNA-directed RNA polymerase III subunit RPC11
LRFVFRVVCCMDHFRLVKRKALPKISCQIEMYFCPFCGTLLQLGRAELFQFFCSTCTYVVPVTGPLTRSYNFSHENKKPDGDDAFLAASSSAAGAEGCQVTSIRCGSDGGECDGEKAQFIQIQMRSADEPPTTFFKCTTCGYQWRSD